MSVQSRVSIEEAQRLLLSKISPLAPVSVPLKNALGLVLAEPVTAAMDQPPFPRSPYDGYALLAQSSAGASPTNPVTLEVVGKIFAGAPANVSICPGQAVRIMTGGVIPDGADCVLMQEKTDSGERLVQIFASLSPHDNYCDRGEDFKTGDLLAPAGMPVTAAGSSVLTSAGVTEVRVFPRPLIAFLSTGDELQNAGEALEPGHIYDSNAAFFTARLEELGVSALALGSVADDMESLMQNFTSGTKRATLVISSGGVSVGQKDFAPKALEALGAEIVFQGVSVKPGMPATFALLEGKPILALSGNPFAAAVTFELLARPAIAKMAADPRLAPQKSRARLAETFEKASPVRRFQRGVLTDGAVTIPAAQGNGQMRTMIGCNCLVELPATDGPTPAGMDVNVYIL